MVARASPGCLARLVSQLSVFCLPSPSHYWSTSQRGRHYMLECPYPATMATKLLWHRFFPHTYRGRPEVCYLVIYSVCLPLSSVFIFTYVILILVYWVCRCIELFFIYLNKQVICWHPFSCARHSSPLHIPSMLQKRCSGKWNKISLASSFSASFSSMKIPITVMTNCTGRSSAI